MLLPALLLVADSLTRPLGALPAGVTDGYATTLRGEAFSYHSAHPTDGSSLLVRSLDSTNAARWTTAPVRSLGAAPRRVAFLAAMDVTDPGQTAVTFWMTVNGTHRFALPQPTTDAAEWRVEGADGIAVEFRRLMIDKFGDVHGILTLVVPAAFAPAGEALTLQVQGENVGRMSWFILYTVSLQPTIRAHAEQMLAREGDALMQTVRLDAWNPFDTSTVAVAVNGTPRLTTRLSAGRATVRVLVPAVRAPTGVAITVSTASARAELPAVTIDPVVPREIHLISHSHLDIGYTDVHAKVRDKHWRALDSALVYIERSRANPDDARFRWNVEGLWPLEAWVASRSAADTARLFDAVRRGDIAISGLYANLMTGLSGSDELPHLVDLARSLRDAHGVELHSAMTSDVPGFTWGLVPALARQGVRYLSSGPNYMPGPSRQGDRIGRTLEAWGDRPFWWIGPSGSDSLLVLTAGRGYSWMGGWPQGRLTIEDAGEMSGYMDDLRARGYPWSIVQVRYAIGGDNGYPDGRLADVVREWNERFVSPHLVISTLPRMFAAFERRHGAALPRIRADLTGYWEDGAVSTTREQIMTRASAARIAQADAVVSLRSGSTDVHAAARATATRELAWRAVLLWNEHTWGADRSISEPDGPETIAQWTLKRQFAFDADSLSRALLAQATDGPADDAVLTIWNTHDAEYRGVTIVAESLSRGGDRVSDRAARSLPSQRLRDGSLALQADLPPMGAMSVRVSSGMATPPNAPSARAAGDSLWNGRVRVRIDRTTGAIASLRWQGRELVDAARGGLNRYRYVTGRDTARARDASVTRMEVVDDGPLVATLRVTSDAPGAASLVREITVHAGSDAVFLVTHLDKLPVREKEAVHIAFPLNVPGGTVRMEQGLAVVRPDADQAEGANRHLYPVQRWLDASNASYGVTVATPDLPLWELNGLTAEAFWQADGSERWLRRALPGTELIAYAMNNYWHTNFKADQPGPVTFRVSLHPHDGFDAAAATRQGLFASEGPLALKSTSRGSGTTFTLDHSRVVIARLGPSADLKADMVRLWNPGDSLRTVRVRWPAGRARRASLSSPAEEAGAPAPVSIAVPPLGSVWLRVERPPRQ